MNEFISKVMSQLGTSEASARTATGGVLGFLKDQAGESDFSALLGKVPGAGDLLQSSAGSGAGSGGGGILGGLMKTAASAVGGDLGSAVGLAGVVNQAGLDSDKVGPFLTMLVGFLRQKAGADLISRIIDQVPDLKKLAGS